MFCHTGSVLSLILLLFYWPQGKAKGISAGHKEDWRWFSHRKYSVWCGEFTPQKHLFLINLLNQFGSSKLIPLTG